MIYFYSCDYHGFTHTLDFNASMYAMADKYDVDGLKELAKHKLFQQLGCCDPDELPIPGLILAIKLIYTSTPNSDRGLRDLLTPVLIDHRVALRKDSGYMALIKSGFADGEFAADVVDALTKCNVERRTFLEQSYCLDCFTEDVGDDEHDEICCQRCGKHIGMAETEEL